MTSQKLLEEARGHLLKMIQEDHPLFHAKVGQCILAEPALVHRCMAEFAASCLAKKDKELAEWQTLYYEARERLCSCNIVDESRPVGDPLNYVCDWCEEHPKDMKPTFTLADRAESAESTLKAREQEIERLKAENKVLDERHVTFIVQGGAVVMASEYDKLKGEREIAQQLYAALEVKLESAERELAELRGKRD